jgi:hypothetical protein
LGLQTAPAGGQTVDGAMKRWQPVTLTFDGPERAENAETFLNYRFDLLMTTPLGQERVVPGFFAADGEAANTSSSSGSKWRVRFLPLEEGAYAYEARFRCGDGVAAAAQSGGGRPCGFDGQSGSFSIGSKDPNASGFYAKGLLSQDGRLMRFSNGDLFIKGGADSPEDLLAYTDFDGTRAGDYTSAYAPHRSDWMPGDPTWDDGRGKALIGAVNYLAAEDVNALSFIPMNVAGDGDNVWPWTGPDERFTYDVSKLAQWNIVFRHATRNGFFLHVKTQETENDSLLGGLSKGSLSDERRVYYRELIARFGHHPALNWSLGEENTNSNAARRAFARYFKALDPYDHPVVVHTYPGQKREVYEPLLGYEPFDGPSIQLGEADAAEAWRSGRAWLSRSREHGDPWVCSVDEPGNASDGVYEGAGGGPNSGNLPESRAVMYASYLAGCYGTEWYFGYDHPDDDLGLDDFRSRDTWWNQVRVARAAVRDFYEAIDAAENTSHRKIESGYAMEGAGGAPQAVAYVEDGVSSFGAAYERVVYVNPRTGDCTGAQPVGRAGLEAPFSGDAVALLSGSASGNGAGNSQ